MLKVALIALFLIAINEQMTNANIVKMEHYSKMDEVTVLLFIHQLTIRLFSTY